MNVTTSTTDQLMVMAAHRYCLGRSTYIVSTCTEFLESVWDQLTSETQQVILQDTRKALETGRIMMDMDRREWMQFLERKG